MDNDALIKENLSRVQERIAACAGKAGRHAKDITLVAVTKTVDAARINAAVACGLHHLGENRVQEYLEKKDEIPGNIFWHLIGQMQTNKVKYIIGGIALLQSLDRITLAREINRQCGIKGTKLDALIEINIAREESKAGIDIDALDSFIEQLAAYEHINIRGLMCIAPFTPDKALVRNCFSRLNREFERLKRFETDRLSMQVLSMGMSQDFEEAIYEGSNMIRIGSAIFGGRPIK
jgi:pyridoxal phosphate enzyme (YggS family)